MMFKINQSWRNSLIVFSLLINLIAQGQNPFLPPTAFIPDGEPHIFEYMGEQRLFVYGSRDERVTAFCGYGHDVWSAPVDDLTRWTDHGEIFHVQQVKDIGYGIVDEQHLGAPDCVYNPVSKKYYLYTFLGAVYEMNGVEGPLPGADNYVPGFEKYGPKCIVAESESPVGPFVNPVMCHWPAANSLGTFDPSVLVDQQADGSVKVYAYWGMKKGDRCAEIDPNDMHTIINSETRLPDLTAYSKTLDEKRLSYTALFEASSIKKVADSTYIFVYSAMEKIPALTYCYANNPLGPWEYGGRIVQNNINYKGGNNHGGIVKVKDQWYITYHKQTTNSFSRQTMIEPIDLIFEEGIVRIPNVEMTSQGILSSGLNAYQRYNANRACYITNGAFIDGHQRNTDGLNPIVGITGENTQIGFKYFDFGHQAVSASDALQLKLNSKVIKVAKLIVSVALPSEANDEAKRIELVSIELKPDTSNNNFQDMIIPFTTIESNEALEFIGGLKGKLAVFLSFKGAPQEVFQLKELEFVKGNKPTPNPLYILNIDATENGAVYTTASKSRAGQSVRITVIPDEGYILKTLQVKDRTNQMIELQKNPRAPYAAESYNFFMPNSEVEIKASFQAERSEISEL